jgi:hypothetical protein
MQFVKVYRRFWSRACYLLHAVSLSAYSSTLKMKVTCSSAEISVDFERTTRRYIPDDRILCNHNCENLISDMEFYMFRALTRGHNAPQKA